jgi:hypothetical protein
MNEHSFLTAMRDAFAHLDIDVDIVTDSDAEVFIDDWIFRVNVVGDIID